MTASCKDNSVTHDEYILLCKNKPAHTVIHTELLTERLKNNNNNNDKKKFQDSEAAREKKKEKKEKCSIFETFFFLQHLSSPPCLAEVLALR